MKCNVAFVTVLSVIAVVIMTDRVSGMPPAQCNPGLLEEVPPRIRKICMALSTIYELGSAMENYIDDKVPQQQDPQVRDRRDPQDVDHVFLRFGRRR